MRRVIVIPARYASTRLPAKALVAETGKPLIQHVYERVSDARGFDEVVVATDDRRILDAVEAFGGRCVMTRADHPSGTDRVAEVAGGLDCDIVVNVQGDEPEIETNAIERVADLVSGGDCPMGTLACSFEHVRRQGIEINSDDASCVKVVFAAGRALYFSRSEIPFPRSRDPEYAGPFLHLGIYAYRRDFLLQLAKLPPTPLELTEGLEQLRVLEHGFSIEVAAVEHACVGIDTPADYAAFVKRYASARSGAGTETS